MKKYFYILLVCSFFLFPSFSFATIANFPSTLFLTPVNLQEEHSAYGTSVRSLSTANGIKYTPQTSYTFDVFSTSVGCQDSQDRNATIKIYDETGTFSTSTATTTINCYTSNYSYKRDLTFFKLDSPLTISTTTYFIIWTDATNSPAMAYSNSDMNANIDQTLNTTYYSNVDPAFDLWLSSTGESCPECEECEECNTTIDTIDAQEAQNDLTFITGYTETFTNGTSSSDMNQVQKHYFHIPFLFWLVIYLIVGWIIQRIILEYLILYREKK